MASEPFRHRGSRAIQRMVEFAPSTGGLALWVRHRDVDDDGRGAAAAFTDGATVFYRPSFAQLPITEQTGLVAHEVLHIALRHPQRMIELQGAIGDADPDLFNICADAIVNATLAHLGWLTLPRDAVRLETVLDRVLGRQQEAEAALLEWDVEKLYRAIDDRALRRSGGRGRSSEQAQSGAADGASGSVGRNGSHASATPQRDDGPRAAELRKLGAGHPRDLVPSPDTRNPPETDAEQTREWRDRITRGHTNDGAFSMLRTLLADLPSDRIPWAQLLRVRLARALARRPSRTWSRPSRSYIANQGRSGSHRLPFEPGTSSSSNEPRLAVVVDVSGSIDARLMQRFAREIEAIARRSEAGLVLIIGDERVRRVEQIAPGRPLALDGREFAGGGGTDFTPLLAEADRHQPDIGVVLTDLDGPANFRPRWPLIWAVPEARGTTSPPFGTLIGLN